MRTRVFWDGYGLENPHSGVAVYAQGLVSGFFASGAGEAAKITLVGSPAAVTRFPKLDHLVLENGHFPAKIAGSKPFWPQRVGRAVESAVTGAQPYVMHGLSNFNTPLFSRDARQRRILTVHDITPLLARESVSKMQALQLSLLMRPAIEASHAIVCISEWTRRTVVERWPEAAERCVVVRNGTPTLALPEIARQPDGSVRLLSVGRYEPYKRMDRLVPMLRALPKTYTATIVTSSAGIADLGTIGGDLVAQGRLTLRSGVEMTELNVLYGQADVLVHPSDYEGFCLPATEALAHGCAVVYQAGTAIDETMSPAVSVAVGRAASLDEWVQGIITAAALTRGSDWHQAVAIHHERLPSWKEAAQALQTLYNQVS